MKFRTLIMILGLSSGMQSFGIDVGITVQKVVLQKAAQELLRALVDYDYDKATSLLKQYPALAKNMEWVAKNGSVVQADALPWVVDVFVPSEKIKQLPGILKLLLDLGADVEKLNNGYTALQWFARNVINNDPAYAQLQKEVAAQILDLLLAHGANINAKSAEGLTPLMIACNDYLLSGKVDIVKLLVEKGNPDLTIVNNKGQTALQILKEKYAQALQRLEEDKKWIGSSDMSLKDKADIISFDQKEVDAIKATIDYLESRTPKAKK